jgi:HEAT repeat
MSKRRRWLVTVTVTAGLVVLALPPVHWRLYGWARGEPFYQGRPASYWSAEIAACEAGELKIVCGTTVVCEPDRGPTMLLIVRPSLLDRTRQRVAIKLDLPRLAGNLDNRWQLTDGDSAALPVLAALLADPAPQVRYYAVQCITNLHEAGRPALPNLQALAGDKGEVFPGMSVADVASYAIHTLEKDEAAGAAVLDATPQKALNPDAP